MSRASACSGHLRNVCAASGVSARGVGWGPRCQCSLPRGRTWPRALPPAARTTNWRFPQPTGWTWGEGVGKDEQLLLADAQTSGGLLIAVAPGRADALVAVLTRLPGHIDVDP